jgi:hypothetical protein
VREVQDEALAALDLKELQNKINEMLISMSEKAMKGLKAVEKADGLLNTF